MVTDLQWANELASDYMLTPVRFDSNGGVETIDFGSQLSSEGVSVVGTDEVIFVNNNYSSPISIPLQLCKVDEYMQALPITADEFSKINRWLNRKECLRLKIKDEGYENIYFIGRINAKAIKVNEVIYGVEISFTSKYPYGFLDDISYKYPNIKNFTIYDHSDEIGEIYPYTTFTCKEPGTLRITNSMDNEILEVKNCSVGEVIKIDNKNEVITTNNENHDIANDFNYNYFKICNTYEQRVNNYSSTLTIDVEIKYNPIRKVGV